MTHGCPRCRGFLVYLPEDQEWHCLMCGRYYWRVLDDPLPPKGARRLKGGQYGGRRRIDRRRTDGLDFEIQ